MLSNFLHSLLVFTTIFVFNTVKLQKVRNNLFQEMDPHWNSIVSKNTYFQQKKSKENTKLIVLKFFFLFLCVLLFFLLVFSFFRGLSIMSSIRYFFVEVYTFKNICQMEIFIIVYIPKECLLIK